MATLSFSDIAGIAQRAGLSPASARVAAAIALAESGGRTDAHNPNAATGDDSYGLWQINMIGKLGPARRQQLGLSSNSDLYDPATNARAMVAISGGGANWKPWSVFTSGAYLTKLNANTATAVPTGPTSSSSVPVGASAVQAGLFDCGLNPLCYLGEAASGPAQKVAGFVVASSYRVGAYALLLLGGVALVVVGAYRTVAPNTSPATAAIGALQ